MGSFGSFLRKRRQQKGLSLQDLSDLLSERRGKGGIAWYPDVPQLSRWERGKTVPRIKHRDAVMAIADILGMEDSEKNELLARAGLSILRPDETDIDAILSTLRPRWRQSWFLSKWMGWNRDQIANKLGIPWFEVPHDIEKAEEELKRLESETKEETKMEQNQSMLNLPPWVNQAQRDHLEGREVYEQGGVNIVTYSGGMSIRQQLEILHSHFPDIHPHVQSFCNPLDDKNVMAQLRGHLPDEAFWNRAKDFWQKARKCDALRDAACERFTSAGEELAPLRPSKGPDLDAYITSGWAHRVLIRALSKEFGFREPDKYYPTELKEGDFTLEDDGLIYRGPDTVAAEQKHRELVKDFIDSDEFHPIVNLMKDLRNLRQQILARIDQCLRKREYSFNSCPDCPADQARKMLTSKGE